MPKLIALAGNPNVGKSTVFNALTGLKQHTGNWAGKTVESARGECRYKGEIYTLVDIPGAYSLRATSREEEVAREYILSRQADCLIVVCDAGCLSRCLLLALQIMLIEPRVVLCVNLMDEARKRGIEVDVKKLEEALCVPVVGASARGKIGLDELMRRVSEVCAGAYSFSPPRALDAEVIARECVSYTTNDRDGKMLRADRFLTGRFTGGLCMLALLSLIFYITLRGANAPSAWLQDGFTYLEARLAEFMTSVRAPASLNRAVTEGVFRTLGWVVAVMLPPMAIFFPLFTLLEDAGYLPRVAFNMDNTFRKCGACGKNALCMCMGLGCNAAGVTGCRIIQSPRERLAAILTNSFTPCNGRFPLLITLSALPFGALAPIGLTLTVALGAGATFLATGLINKTVLRGVPSFFTLELPPFRRPQIGRVLARSALDRTLRVLCRAIAVAAPAGAIIFLMANVSVSGQSLILYATRALDPFGRLLGMDGAILTAFILALPANELVLPILMMIYSSSGALAREAALSFPGWTNTTALCVMLFSLMHWPCLTTLITIRKETGSFKWTLLSFLLPTLFGMTACLIVNQASLWLAG